MKFAAAAALFFSSLATAAPTACASPQNPSPPAQPGVQLKTCVNPKHVALTFDDGPFTYTSDLVALLSQYNAKATFFINGNNWVDLAARPDLQAVVLAAQNAGHTIGSHSMTHPDFDQIDSTTRVKEMGDLATLVKQITGRTTTLFRPPYGSCGDACMSDLNGLGYTVVHWDVDTKDYNYEADSAFPFTTFHNLVEGGEIVLMHDVHEFTVKTLMPKVLEDLKTKGLQAVNMDTCMSG